MGADCLWRGSSDRAEQVCQGWLGGEGRAQFTAARSLVVQDVGGILCLKILHLQDPVKVLQPLVIVGHVGGQVAVDDADIVAVKLQKDVDTPFVPLEGGQEAGDTPLFSHPGPEGRWSQFLRDLPGQQTLTSAEPSSPTCHPRDTRPPRGGKAAMRGTGLDRVPRFISPPLFNSFIPFFSCPALKPPALPHPVREGPQLLTQKTAQSLPSTRRGRWGWI